MSKRMMCAGAVGLSMVAACASGADLVYGVTQNQTLVSFQSNAPGSILSGVPIQGLQPNETIHGIDLRPATGELYALGSFSRMYRINPMTGMATQVGMPFATPLNGSSFGFDFNPTVDRIRIVSDADQNLRANPNDGTAIVDSPLSFAPGDVNFGVNPNGVHAAYTNNRVGAMSTTLYVIDTNLDALLIQNPANSGLLTTVGPIGADVTDLGGFDISGVTGIAYAAVRDTMLARTTFWTIDLATGTGMMIGEVGGGSILTAITVVPAPGAAGLLAAGGLIALRRRR
ncbi:MAG: DUF4394 domain-containing protein [Phycisphaeraceae bacterium]|nr:DUF4394 domain-containing protein [Phycisphaeraceae bacterium]